MAMIRMRQKMFSNSGGFGFNVSLSTERLCSLNLPLRRRLCIVNAAVTLYPVN